MLRSRTTRHCTSSFQGPGRPSSANRTPSVRALQSLRHSELHANLGRSVHILEYENYKGYDKTTQMIRDSPHADAYKAMLPFLNGRSSQLTQEFAFFPTAPPHEEGGIFELRSYQLKAGALLEWEHAW